MSASDFSDSFSKYSISPRSVPVSVDIAESGSLAGSLAVAIGRDPVEASQRQVSDGGQLLVASSDTTESLAARPDVEDNSGKEAEAAAYKGPAPINCLPDEVLAPALRWAFLSPRYVVRDPSRRRRIVASVCHTWARVINGDHESWNHIVVDHHMPLISLHEAITKSGALTFSFEFVCSIKAQRSNSDFLDWLFQAVGTVLPRCKELRVRSHFVDSTLAIMKRLEAAPLPALCEVQFELALPMVPRNSYMPNSIVPFLSAGALPSLTRASFAYGLPDWPWSGSSANLTVVRLARLSGVIVAHAIRLYSFLSACPNLSELALHFVDAVPPPLTPSSALKPYDGPLIALRKLVRLHLSLETHHAVSVVAPLRAPALESLALFAPDDRTLNKFVLDCRDLLRFLHTLVLAVNISTHEPLRALLLATPYLRRLDARRSAPSFVDHFYRLSLFALSPSLTLKVVVTNYFPPPLVTDVLLYRSWASFDPAFSIVSMHPHPVAGALALTEWVRSNDLVFARTRFDYLDWMVHPSFPVFTDV
ncbi:hypothetical protein R3P38DRAFT_3217783 [Favolaschia claudopus]|uniref:F-box domain-containing protein n=1 Tax=Favolaschia claudopus TaxID=2862362 RepID=A0AAW0A487_9AGAR